MTSRSVLLLVMMVGGLLLVEFRSVESAAASSEPRVIVYREIGEDGYPAEHKTLTVWDYPKPTSVPQKNDRIVEPIYQEEEVENQLVVKEEHSGIQDDTRVIEDIQVVTVTQIMEVVATAEPASQPSQVIPEESPIGTVVDPPEGDAVVVVADPSDDQPTITTVVTVTISSTKTISGTSITTITVTEESSDDDMLSQNSLTSTFSIAKDDLLFRANWGQRHSTDNLLCIAMVMIVALGAL